MGRQRQDTQNTSNDKVKEVSPIKKAAGASKDSKIYTDEEKMVKMKTLVKKQETSITVSPLKNIRANDIKTDKVWEPKTRERTPLLTPTVKRSNEDIDLGQSSVRRSGRAPIPSSKYREAEFLSYGQKRKADKAEYEVQKKKSKYSSQLADDSGDSVDRSLLTSSSDGALHISSSVESQITSESDGNDKGSDAITNTDKSDPEISFQKLDSDMTEETDSEAGDEDNTEQTDSGAEVPGSSSVENMFSPAQEEQENTGDIISDEQVEDFQAQVLVSEPKVETDEQMKNDDQSEVLEDVKPNNRQKNREDDHSFSTSAETVVVSDGKAITTFPSSNLGGTKLQLTGEQNGNTLEVVTIPASVFQESTHLQKTVVRSVHKESAQEVIDSEKGKKTYSELVSVTPTGHSLGQVAIGELAETPFATVLGQDGATYLNLAVEATQISSILKSKPVTAMNKSSNPLKGHGRVLRNPSGSMIVRTALDPPRQIKSEVSTSETKPVVSYSLISSNKSPAEASSVSPSKVGLSTGTMSSKAQGLHLPQRIVIKQQAGVKTPTVSTSALARQITQSGKTITIIDLSPDVAAKHFASSKLSLGGQVISTTDAIPKSASEILLQKLREQPESVATNAEDQEVTEKQLIIAPETAVEESDKISSSADVVESSETCHTTVEEKTCSFPDSKNSDTSNDLVVEPESKPQKCDIDDQHKVSDNKPDSIALSPDSLLKQNTEAGEVCDKLTVSPNCKTLQKPLLSSNSKEACQPITSKLEIPKKSAVTPESEASRLDLMAKVLSLTNNVASIISASVSSSSRDKIIDKITVVDNGVEYDVKIMSEEEVTEEIVDDSSGQVLELELNGTGTSHVLQAAEVEIKQEVKEEDEEFNRQEVGKQTSSTQTAYSQNEETTILVTEADTTTTCAVTGEDKSKRQLYYVSVPNKGIMAKTKTSMYSSAATWMIDERGMYCCEKCDYQTDRKANFYKHRRSHAGAKPHMCPICQYKAGTSSNLKRHMGIHRDIREHKCDICGLCFRQKIHLERHIKYKHEEKSIKCPLCDYICANEQPDLRMHIKRKHTTDNSEETVTCPQCNIQVGSKKDLKQHLKFHKDGPELKLFCNDCSFVTDCQSRLKRHTAIHSKMKPFQCGVCSYRAAQKEHVLRHLRTQHKIDIKRDGKRPWRRHKKAALEDGSKEKADFTSGDKIFACNHCVMRFAKLINLYKHLHTQHKDIMPAEAAGNFYCVVCEFSTTNKKNLLVHMRRHNMIDQTPPTHVYSCMLCRYVNPRRRNLFQHMRKKHNIHVKEQNEDDEEDGDSQEMEISCLIGTVHDAMEPDSSSSNNLVSLIRTSDSVRMSQGDVTDLPSVIKIEDLSNLGSGGEGDEIQTLVIDTREVSESVKTTRAADGLEGLQALAEQAGLIDNIIEEQVQVLDDQTIVIDQSGGDIVQAVGEDMHQVSMLTEALVVGQGETYDKLELSEETYDKLELSEDQLAGLQSGDVVEMEGQLYLVELSQDSSNPHKQVYSFLPVSTTADVV